MKKICELTKLQNLYNEIYDFGYYECAYYSLIFRALGGLSLNIGRYLANGFADFLALSLKAKKIGLDDRLKFRFGDFAEDDLEDCPGGLHYLEGIGITAKFYQKQIKKIKITKDELLAYANKLEQKLINVENNAKTLRKTVRNLNTIYGKKPYIVDIKNRYLEGILNRDYDYNYEQALYDMADAYDIHLNEQEVPCYNEKTFKEIYINFYEKFFNELFFKKLKNAEANIDGNENFLIKNTKLNLRKLEILIKDENEKTHIVKYNTFKEMFDNIVHNKEV